MQVTNEAEIVHLHGLAKLQHMLETSAMIASQAEMHNSMHLIEPDDLACALYKLASALGQTSPDEAVRCILDNQATNRALFDEVDALDVAISKLKLQASGRGELVQVWCHQLAYEQSANV